MTINQKELAKLFASLSISPEDAQQFAAHGIEFSLGTDPKTKQPQGLVASKGGEVLWKHEMVYYVIEDLIFGHDGGAPGDDTQFVVKAALKAMFLKMLANLTFTDPLVAAVGGSPLQQTMAAAAPKPDGWKPTLGGDMALALKDATTLYQQVRGTSTDSIYFVIAIGEHIKVAARWKGTKLSLRVEGNMGLAKERITKAGFKMAAPDAKYASLHLNPTDDMLATKAVGAILLGLNENWKTPLPKVHNFKNMGA